MQITKNRKYGRTLPNAKGNEMKIISRTRQLLTIAGTLAGFLPGLQPPTQAQAPVKPVARFHTRSIVGCDPATSQCGIAVVSFPAGVPAVVPVGEAGVMIANQGIPSFSVA